MYRKALVNGEMLYFVYAPPQSYLDTLKQKLPKAPYPGAPRHESSVYYYWWAFLRLNEGYIDCCKREGQGQFAELYRSFGDVRDGQRVLDEYGEFKAWWVERGAKLFSEPEQSEYVQQVTRAQAEPDSQRFTLVSVPLRGDLETTMKAIRALLQPEFEGYREQHGHFSQVKFPVFSKPVLSRLDIILKTRLARDAAPDDKLHEIADGVGIRLNRLPENIVDINRHKAERVHEYLEAAKALICNVGEGRFPDYTIPGAVEDRAKPKKPEIDWNKF